MPDPTPAPDNTPAPQPNMVSEQEVIARIEKARQEEKQKLYADLQALNAKLETANLSVSQLESIQQKLARAEADLAALGKAKTAGGDIDIKALLNEAKSAVEASLSEKIRQLEDRLAEKDREAVVARLSALKQQLVSDAKGRIIAAMVVGNTEEAIRASAKEAMAEYERIVAANVTNPGAPVPPPPINPRAAGGGENPPASGVDGYKKTGDTKAYATNREALMSDLKKRFG